MAISKIVYKSSPSATPVTWMDVTQKTVTSGTMLNGTTALKNDGTDITGNIASKTSSNLSASGATVTAEAGYYASSASKTVASGTEGTPTATKGTVSNHAVSVTPSVTNTAGYISGGTKTGTAVTVSASELVSGSETKTANGTYDVTNLAELVVNVSGGSGTDTLTALLNNTLTTLTYNGTGTLPRDLCYNKTAITSVSMPNITALPDQCFDGCTGVTSVDFSSVQTIATYSLRYFGRGNLTTLHLPSLTTTTGSGYSLGYLGTSAVPVTLVLPALTSMSTDLLRGGYLAAIDFGPNLASLNNRTFYGTSRYDVVILRRTAGVVTCTNVNALSALTSSTKVYVPSALISSYQADSSWSTKGLTFYAIEGSDYENAYADGTPIS